MIGEPSIEETIDILKGLKSYYQEHHGVTYSDEAIELAKTWPAKGSVEIRPLVVDSSM